MRTKFIAFLFSAVLFPACQFDTVDPLVVGPDPEPWRIERDSIQTGSYLDIAIGDAAEAVYPKIQALQDSKGVSTMTVVSNIFSDLALLRTSIPLYSYILLDQSAGSDSGVQISIEAGKIKAIYLNSGKKLSKWPNKGNAASSVRINDDVNALYGKFSKIQQDKSYTPKFERISLMGKNLNAAYDPAMTQSPQWYFGYSTGQDAMDQIQVHFQAGKVTKIGIAHYSKY
jgi:hypothetical protein